MISEAKWLLKRHTEILYHDHSLIYQNPRRVRQSGLRQQQESYRHVFLKILGINTLKPERSES
jgi:hypothetical protein